MTLQQAAQAAIDVQNACNLSGVVRTFAEITAVLWDEARRQRHGTDFVNQHPISQLFASKIADLTRVEYDSLTYSRAYDAAKALAAGA